MPVDAMRTSLSTACLVHLPLKHVFRLAAECGYAGVELSVNAEVWWQSPQRVRRLAEAAGVEIFSVHQTLLPARLAPGGAKMVDAVRTALAMDVPRVVIHTPLCAAWDQPAAAHWRRELDECRALAAGSGLILALENPGAGQFQRLLSRLDDQMAFVDEYGLGVTLDTCHAGTAGVDLVAACRTIGERLTNVHFSDLRPNPEILVMGAPSQPVSLKRRLGTAWHATHTLFAHHQMPGPEGLSLAALLHELARQGYDGPLTMEINPFALHAWSSRQAAARMSELLAYVAAVAADAVPAETPVGAALGERPSRPGTMAGN